MFAAVVYAYVAYAVLAWTLSRVVRTRQSNDDSQANSLPSISLLIAAHNEEDCIAARIRNALELDYPRERLDIFVASDGSSDRTCEIVREFESQGVRLLDYRQNRGKSTTLNASFPQTTGELVVFSDANTMYERDALQQLVRPFADPNVGIVCGKLILQDPSTGKNVDSMYWRYETFLKKCEGKIGALLGANGAIYAIRRDLFVPIPDNTIVDDFVIPLLAKLRHGCRIVYEPAAIAYEETPCSIRAEFRRRSRIGAGGYQSLALLWPLLSPRFGWTAFAFFSHKVLRWMVPFLLLGMIVCNVFLLGEPLYQITMGAQVLFFGLSVVGSMVPGRNLAVRVMRLATMFSRRDSRSKGLLPCCVPRASPLRQSAACCCKGCFPPVRQSGTCFSRLPTTTNRCGAELRLRCSANVSPRG
jgi:cellulose synthase/poly-beta-1,6-N-acetylglucosamine synthase-like glycosyltransferase